MSAYDPPAYWERRGGAGFRSYREGADRYDERGRLLALAARYGWRSLLDFGCGTGYHFPTWIEAGSQATGVDPARSQVAEATRTAAGLRSPIPVHHVDWGAPLPFAPDAFDVAVSVRVLLHVPGEELPALLAELGRVAPMQVHLTYWAADPPPLAGHCFNHDYLSAFAAARLTVVGAEQRFVHQWAYLVRRDP